MKRVVDFLLYSNIYLGLSTALLAISSCLLLGTRIFYSLILFILCSTVLSYNVSRLYTILNFVIKDVPDRIKWGRDNKKTLYGTMFLSLIGSIFFFLQLNFNTQIAAILLGGLSVGYTLPIGGKRLRDIGWLKIIIIAITWGGVTVLLPVLSALIVPSNYYILLVATILYTLAITIPFDLRDKEADTNAGIKTIAHYMSFVNAHRLSIALFSLYCAVCLWYTFQIRSLGMGVATFVFFMIGHLILSFTKLFFKDKYCLLVIDGLPILYGILLVLESLILSN